jgi:anti-sigma-K factor RskA
VPPDGNIGSAHPEAADWVLGTLGPAEREEFQRHLAVCPHCRAAVAEFGDLGRTLRHLPPAVEPSPDLEARIITSVLAASIAQRAAVPATDVAPDVPPGGGAKIIRLPRRPGRRGLLAAAVAVAAAAVIAAGVVILPGSGAPAGTLSFRLASPTGQAASGTVTAVPDNASGSWNITLTVRHLPDPGSNRWYECWWMGPEHEQASAGTFIVGNDGNGTFPMTIAVDPHQFPTIEVIEESASGDGTPHGTVVLVSKA